MIAVLVTLIAPAFTGAVGPKADPPDNAGLVPTFSGLNVENQINTDTFFANGAVTGGSANFDSVVTLGNISAGNNLEAGANLTVNGTSTLNGETNVNGLFYVDSDQDGKAELQGLGFNTGIIGKYSDGAYMAVENFFGSILLKSTVGAGTVTIEANDFNVNGPMDVDGKLTANQVGSYYQIYRKAKSTNYTFVNCYSGDYLTSCNGKTSSSLVYAYPSNNICQVKSSSSGTIYARAVCFDPDGTYSGIINADS